MRDRFGGLHSARCLIWSFDFAEVEAPQAVGTMLRRRRATACLQRSQVGHESSIALGEQQLAEEI
jgi:hypothetical protein